jgi:glycosyltransferase involved in cell wall biosynthesis
MQPLVTILIPNYNEIENVKRDVLNNIHSYLKKQKYSYEIVISDDGSTDTSVLAIKEFVDKHSKEMRIIYNQHAGKPFALRSGIKEAKGKFVLLTDMDQSTPISELDNLLPWASKGFDVVIGSRGAKRPDTTPIRQLASIVFLLIRRMILLPEIKDTQCGFKLIETNLANRIFAKMRLFGRVNTVSGWKVTAYDVELLHVAKKLGAKIKEVRVSWRNEDTTMGKSRNFIKESIEMLFEIMRVRANDMLGKYDR